MIENSSPPPPDSDPLNEPDSSIPPVIPTQAAEIPSPPPPAPAPTEEPFIFHGNAREYFRIWIVNTLLTLLTLGIYAAWAKVRKRRYFRGNIELMGYRFDYLAEPRRILIGNILVAVMFLAYMVVGEVYPAIRVGALFVGLALLPWVGVRSLSFNAHNTAYRGMRFYSRQGYGMAALTFIGQWFFIALSLGLYYPAWVRNRKEFVVNSHRLGDAFFKFESKIGPFYAAYLLSGLMVFGVVAIGGFITNYLTSKNSGHAATMSQLVPFFILYGAALFFSKHYVYARLFNHIWSHTRLDNHSFKANLSVSGWLKLQAGNLVATIFSLGLLYPWAAVRSTHYTLASLRFVPSQPIEKISRLGDREGSAIGETAAEFVGLDFGL